MAFIIIKTDPNDLVVIDRHGKSKPYKRNFWEKIGQVIKYGETLESFTIMSFQKINNQYYCYYDCIAGSLTNMPKLIQGTASNYYEPTNRIAKYLFEFTRNQKKYSLNSSENGGKIEDKTPK